MKALMRALALASVTYSSVSVAQQSSITQTIAGTRLDLVATGEVSRTPDMAIITAGAVSRATDASGALGDSAARMERVIAALKRAGVVSADIQTGNVSLNPEIRYPDNQAPQLVGYTASNVVTVRLRNLRSAGAVIDALVAAGANQINGPSLAIDRPEAALDEARAKAIALGRSRAELYARSLGLRVARVVTVNETDSGNFQPPIPVMMEARSAAKTSIEPGEQKLRVSVGLTFELQ